MGDICLCLDPDILSKLKLIFDVGGYYANIRCQEFKDFMRINSFWPDFDEEAGKPNENHNLNDTA